MSLRRDRLVALIGVFAVALNALWPLISQAQAKDTSVAGIICTSQGGVQAVDLSGGKRPIDGGADQKHCKLCIVGGDRTPALHAGPVFAQRTALFAAESPAAKPATEFRSTLDSPAQPRAPPSRI